MVIPGRMSDGTNFKLAFISVDRVWKAKPLPCGILDAHFIPQKFSRFIPHG